MPFAVVPALYSVLFHFTHLVTSGYSISLTRGPARGTSQLYLHVTWTSAFKQFFQCKLCDQWLVYLSVKLKSHNLLFRWVHNSTRGLRLEVTFTRSTRQRNGAVLHERNDHRCRKNTVCRR